VKAVFRLAGGPTKGSFASRQSHENHRTAYSEELSMQQTVKAQWRKPAFQVTSTGFEVTMYLGTDSGAAK
jgi:coenzyme PQQ precursor peptide PqqA